MADIKATTKTYLFLQAFLYNGTKKLNGLRMTVGKMDLIFSYDGEDKTCTCNFGASTSKNLHSEDSVRLRSVNDAKPCLGEKYSKTWRQLEPVLCIVSSGEL